MVQRPPTAMRGRSGTARGTSRATACTASSNKRSFGLLNASSILPQGPIVKGVKTGWKLAFQTMMQELAPQDVKGGYQRPSYSFGNSIGDPKFPVHKNRYHLYVGNACPWCHRVLIAIAVLGLQEYISFTWLLDDAERASRGGWVFDGSTGLDPVFGAQDLRDVYSRCSPGFSGRCTAPLLVDKLAKVAVCNDSGVLLDNLYHLATMIPDPPDIQLKPADLAADINQLNDFIYQNINNAVYRSGFATEQGAYLEAQADLELGLAEVESRLGSSRFLMGDTFTDADLRLLPTVVRYDAVYNSLFRCTRRRIAADCPNLQAWMQDVWLLPCSSSMKVSDTFDVAAAQKSYFGQLFPLNPSGLVPVGPTAADLKLGADPQRGALDTSVVYTTATNVTL
eukprot:jgi/Ulvmu1/7833/UM004_0062.1